MANFFIALVNRPGSFSDKWLQYLQSEGIHFDIVDPYDNNFSSDCLKYTHFLWHWHHTDHIACNFAPRLIGFLESHNIKCFPSSSTLSFYDDKNFQRHIFYSLGISTPPTQFYTHFPSRPIANNYPFVLKKLNGAGSSNVFIIHNYLHLLTAKFVYYFFGFSSQNPFFRPFQLLNRILTHPSQYFNVKFFYTLLRSLIRALTFDKLNYIFFRQKNGFLVQEFIPNLKYDIRLVVVGHRVFGFIRNTLNNDFRASGSGSITYDLSKIPDDLFRKALDISRHLNSQSLALDFVKSHDDIYFCLEMSPFYSHRLYYPCDFVWTEDCMKNKIPVIPEIFIIKDLLELK